ncbi:MAG: PTS sugar transporter subunit IIA [Gemmataceae bacterium]|nr:PTS sugar transporter subunit IIA [Gemmataceae bacterium]
MSNDTMDLEQLARYLQRDAREVGRLADRGRLPGRKVAGAWRFSLQEVKRWLEQQLGDFSDEQLRRLEQQHTGTDEHLIASLLHEACVAVPMRATTRASALRELVTLAEQSWQVYDPQAVLEAVQAREDLATTALEFGVAVPHMHRPIPGAVGESLIAFGRASSALPFGSADGGLTDLFFLVLCQDEGLHLKVLARLARLFLRPGFLDTLRDAPTGHAARQIIVAAEEDLLAKTRR